MGKPIALSWSREEAFSQCPYLYERKFVSRLEAGDVAPMAFGALAHRILAGHLERARTLSAGQRDGSGGATLAMDVLEEEWAKRPAVIGEDRRDELEGIVRNGVDDAEGHWDTLVDVELQLALDLDGQVVAWDAWDRVGYRVIVDRLDMLSPTHAVVTDWKTSWKVHADKGQLRRYAWALFQMNPQLEHVDTVVRFIRWPRASQRATFSRGDVARVGREIQRVREDLAGRILKPSDDRAAWPATPGEGCATCPFPCPIATESTSYAGPPPIQDQGRAEELLAEVVALKRQVDFRSKALQGWARQHGPITAAGTAAGYWPSKSVTMGAEEVIKLAEAEGLDPAPYLTTLGAAAYEKMADKGDTVARAALESVRQPTRWTLKKAEPGASSGAE